MSKDEKKVAFKEAAKKYAKRFGFTGKLDFEDRDGGVETIIPQSKVFAKPFFFNGDNLVTIKARGSSKNVMTIKFDEFIATA